jgi:hypothetical protein
LLLTLLPLAIIASFSGFGPVYDSLTHLVCLEFSDRIGNRCNTPAAPQRSRRIFRRQQYQYIYAALGITSRDHTASA